MVSTLSGEQSEFQGTYNYSSGMITFTSEGRKHFLRLPIREDERPRFIYKCEDGVKRWSNKYLLKMQLH